MVLCEKKLRAQLWIWACWEGRKINTLSLCVRKPYPCGRHKIEACPYTCNTKPHWWASPDMEKIFSPEKLIKSHSECKEKNLDVRESWVSRSSDDFRENIALWEVMVLPKSFNVNCVRPGADNSGGHPWSPRRGRSRSGFGPVISELDFWGIGLPGKTVFKADSFGDFMGPHDSIIFKWIFLVWSH